MSFHFQNDEPTLFRPPKDFKVKREDEEESSRPEEVIVFGNLTRMMESSIGDYSNRNSLVSTAWSDLDDEPSSSSVSLTHLPEQETRTRFNQTPGLQAASIPPFPYANNHKPSLSSNSTISADNTSSDGGSMGFIRTPTTNSTIMPAPVTMINTQPIKPSPLSKMTSSDDPESSPDELKLKDDSKERSLRYKIITALIIIFFLTAAAIMLYFTISSRSKNESTNNDTSNQKNFKRYNLFDIPINDIIVTPSNPSQWLLARSDGQIIVFDASANRTAGSVTVPSSSSPITKLILNNRSGSFYSAQADGTVSEFSLESKSFIRSNKDAKGSIQGLTLNQQGTRLYTTGSEGIVREYNAQEGILLRNMSIASSETWTISLDQSERNIFVGSSEKFVHQYELDKNVTVKLFTGPEAPVRAIIMRSLSLNGSSNPTEFLFSGSMDKIVRQYDHQNSSFVRLFETEHEIQCLDVSTKHNRLYAGGADGKITVWDISSGRRMRVLRQHVSGTVINSVLINDNANSLISTGSDGSVIQWDLHETI